LTLLPRIEPGEVQHLLAESLLVVSNGGTTLIHSLAHGRPIISIPLAGDQDRRIRRAVRLQIAATADRTPERSLRRRQPAGGSSATRGDGAQHRGHGHRQRCRRRGGGAAGARAAQQGRGGRPSTVVE